MPCFPQVPSFFRKILQKTTKEWASIAVAYGGGPGAGQKATAACDILNDRQKSRAFWRPKRKRQTPIAGKQKRPCVHGRRGVFRPKGAGPRSGRIGPGTHYDSPNSPATSPRVFADRRKASRSFSSSSISSAFSAPSRPTTVGTLMQRSSTP